MRGIFLTTIHTFASGSSGNAALFSRNGTHILLDAGISCRRITSALRSLDLAPEDLSAVLITHTHTDHISGLATIVRSWDVPIYASSLTAEGIARRVAGAVGRLRPFEPGQALPIGAFTVIPFATSHDAPGSTGYRLDEAGALTDSGYVTADAAKSLCGVRLLLLEANHDEALLRSGPYPYYLKRRILSAQGHLSNAAAAEFAVSMAQNGARELVLAHLSAENNTPDLALSAVSGALDDAGFSVRVSVAPRSEPSVRYAAEEPVCRR